MTILEQDPPPYQGSPLAKVVPLHGKVKTTSGTNKFAVDDVIAEICDNYLDEIDPRLTGFPAPHASEIKQTILTRTNLRFEIINSGLTGHDRVSRLKLLVPSQLARILIRLHHTVMITAGGLGANKTYDLIGIYVAEGTSEGTYATNEIDISAIARRYNQELTIGGANEVMHILREKAPQVTRTVKAELTPFANGIWNYRTRQLMAFDPSLIFTSKMATPVDPNSESPVYFNASNPDPASEDLPREIDATEVSAYEAKGWIVDRWDVVEWISSLSDDPEMVALLWQIIGASLRPYVRWNKTAWFYSERGNNGKGTLAELMRLVIGEGTCAVLPLANFGKDFMLEPLMSASAIINDENDVGLYLDKVANLKAIVTNDVISINRKGLVPINYRFWGFMVQCLNEFPQIRDRTESFYRRQLFVPFEKHFEDGGFTYIKDDYLKRPAVNEYVVKHVMTLVDEYWKLSEPEATKRVLDRYKEANDPVREFWIEFEDIYVWDLLPFGFLFDHYKAWFVKTHPSGRLVGRTKFIDAMIPVVRESTTWFCEDRKKTEHTGNKMASAELLIMKYDLTDWKQPGYTGKDPRQMCIPAVAVNYRGLQRYAPGN